MKNAHHVVSTLIDNYAIAQMENSIEKLFTEHLFNWERLMMEWKSILNDSELVISGVACYRICLNDKIKVNHWTKGTMFYWWLIEWLTHVGLSERNGSCRSNVTSGYEPRPQW